MFRGGDQSLRVITNRYREKDGGEMAAENLITWLRNNADCPFPKTLALVYAFLDPPPILLTPLLKLLLQHWTVGAPSDAPNLPNERGNVHAKICALGKHCGLGAGCATSARCTLSDGAKALQKSVLFFFFSLLIIQIRVLLGKFPFTFCPSAGRTHERSS